MINHGEALSYDERDLVDRAFELDDNRGRSTFFDRALEHGGIETAIRMWARQLEGLGLSKIAADVRELRRLSGSLVSQMEFGDLAGGLTIPELQCLVRGERNPDARKELPLGMRSDAWTLLRLAHDVATLLPGATWREIRAGLDLGR